MENFTGKTAEAVRQDFYSTIFLTNYESVLTEEEREKISEKTKDSDNKRAINKAVSFNAIKNAAFDLFYSDGDRKKNIEKITKLFIMNLTSTRKNRTVQRKKTSLDRSLDYQRRTKKMTF